MPQIVEYVNREGITPTDRGTEARVQEGRRIGASFNQVAENLRDFGNRVGQQIGSAVRDAGDAAVAWQDQRQIHQGATIGAGIFNQLTQSLNDTVNSIDPNDPAYSSKVDMAQQQWRQNKLEPTLDQFYQGFTTEKSKAWAEQHIDQMRQHFYMTGAAEVAKSASLGVKTGAENTLNGLTSTVVQDPSATDTALNLWESSVNGMVGSAHGINTADAANARTSFVETGSRQIVNNAAQSAIRKAADPEGEAQKWIKKYPNLIDGNLALKLAKDATTQTRINRNTDLANERYQREKSNDDAKIAANKAFTKNVTIDPVTHRPVINAEIFKDFSELPQAFPGATDAAPLARTYIDWAENQLKDKKNVVTDPDVKTDLFARMGDPNNPTSRTEILSASVEDKLDQHDTANLLNLQKSVEEDPESSHLYREIMPSVRGLLGNDPKGNEMYAKFLAAFFPTFRTLPPEQRLKALDLNDPNSLLSKVLAPYRRSPLEIDIAKKGMGLELSPETMESIRNSQGNIPVPSGTRPGQVPPRKVKSLEDAQKLNPGTRYETPDGKVFVR